MKTLILLTIGVIEETHFFYIAVDDGEFVIHCGQPEMR